MKLRLALLAAAVVAVAVGVTPAPASAAVGPPAWTSKTLPTFDPTGASSPGSGLSGISCPASDVCYAVGSYSEKGTAQGSDYQGQLPYVARWNGSAWTETALPHPSSWIGISLTDISCTSTTSCIAVGSDFKNVSGAPGLQTGFSEILTGSGWAYQDMPLGPGAFLSSVYGVSCTSATACTAIGSDEENGNAYRSTAYSWNGSGWTATGVAGASGGPTYQQLGRISCWTATDCVAVGNTSTGTGVPTPFVETLSSSGWSQTAFTKPSYATGGASVTGVSCTGTTASACVVVGSGIVGTDPNTSYGSAFAQKLDGSGATQLNPDTVHDTSDLSGISCIDPSDCVAVGNYYSSSQNPLVEVLSGGSWQQATVGAPSGTHTSLNLSAVSCAGDLALCTAASSVDGGQTPYVATNVGSAPVATVSKLAVSAPASATSGTAFNVTLTAQTSGGSTVTSFSGSKAITFSGPASSPDGTAPSYPTTVSFSNGVGTASVTLRKAETATISATDGSHAGIAGNATVVSPGAAASFSVGAPGSCTAGTSCAVSVRAKDAAGNTATGFSGTVSFSSSDTQATLPASAALSSGTGSFSVTFATAGNQTITATSGSVTGTSGGTAVSPAAASTFSVSAPGSTTAGAAINATVTAKDTYGNTATAFSGTVSFSSTDTAATLPASTTLTNGTTQVSLTYKTVGTQTVTATSSAVTGTSGQTTVSAGAATHLAVSGPTSSTAGEVKSLSVTALDAFSNTVTGFSGTVSFSSSDTQATLPSSTVLTGGSATLPLTYATAGDQTVTATSGAVTGTSAPTTVSPAATDHLTVTAPSTAVAGSSAAVTVTAVDAFGNTTPAYSGTVHVTSTDPQATLPADVTLTGGTASTSVTFTTAGDRTVTATDTAASAITGTSATTTVAAAAATTLVVLAPTTATSGSPVTVSVTARDAYGNVATGYTGTVQLTSSDAAAVLPASTTLTAGTKDLSVTLETAGSQTVTATDTVSSSITGTSAGTDAAAGAVTHISVTTPATATAGTPVTVGLVARDAAGNPVTTDSTTVLHLTSSDPAAVLPADVALSHGTGSASVTLETVGDRTVTATDTVTSSTTGTSGPTTVGAAAAATLVVLTPTTATAGTASATTVTAEDRFGNVATGYTGTVHLTSSDPHAVLPADAALSSGVGHPSVTYETAGDQTLTATDTATAAITGTSAATTVSPAATSVLVVTAPATGTAGTAVDAVVIAKDTFGNVTPAFAGTVHWTSTDGAATLPADGTLTNGTATRPVTYTTAGPQTVTAASSGVTSGTSGTTTVAAAPADHYVVTAPATATTGTPVTLSLTAQDRFGNVATSWTGAHGVAVTGPHAAPDATTATVPSSVTFTSGVGSAPVTLVDVESVALKVTDTTTSAITGTSAPVAVAVGPLARLAVTGAATTTQAGVPVSFSSLGFDAFSNPRGDQTSATTFTASGGGVCTVASCRITAATPSGHPDTVTGTEGSVSGTASLAVTPAPFDHIIVTTGPAGSNGQPVSVTVTGVDPFGNPTGDVTGQATLSISPDGSCTTGSCTPTTGGPHTISASVTTADGTTVTTGSATSSPGFRAPDFSRAVLRMGDGSSTATYAVDAHGAGPLLVTFTATSPGQPTRTVTGSAASGTITVTGLKDGVAYSFTLTASTPQGTASVVGLNKGTPMRVSKLSLRSAARRVPAGSTVLLTGTLTNGGHPVANRQVVLTATVAGITRTVRTVRTDRHGAFRVTQVVSARTVFVAISTAGPKTDPTVSKNKPVVVTTG